MSNLITRWRRLVDDAGTAVWDDDEAQDLLDRHRVDIWAYPLAPITLQENGTTVWKTYSTRWRDLEESASGSAAWRLYDSNGSAVSAGTVDYVRGIVTFSADQMGSARYLDHRSYDVNAAAADGWRERAGTKASAYTFSADGASYNRSDWFDHCRQMAKEFDSMARAGNITLTRSDLSES